jgi:mono/diheme cytochrome c family protein
MIPRAARYPLLAGTAVAIAFCAWPVAIAQVGQFSQEQRGHYLVDAGDCVACHTAEGGKPFAGGRPIETPFGIIYSANITPDPETGIGAWTGDQFYRAMHEGVAADGTHLYPAFPYPWFTKVKREDVDAIRAYLRTLPAVKTRRPPNKLPWPLSETAAMAGWNELFFKPGNFRPDKTKSGEWNRGAYLVQGLGHCGACHSPKNILGAVQGGSRYQGADIQHWYAPDLTGTGGGGLKDWSVDDIARFLKTGHNKRTEAYGPMAEVVTDSTSKLKDSDLHAIATYIKSLPGRSESPRKETPGKNVMDAGAAIYADQCSACHMKNGEGVKGVFPTLKGNSVVQSREPTTVVRLILNGGHGAWTMSNPNAKSMPSFGWKLSDGQIASVATFVRNSWGNSASIVTSGQVHDLRTKVEAVTSAN